MDARRPTIRPTEAAIPAEPADTVHSRLGESLADVFMSPHPWHKEVNEHWLTGKYHIVMATPKRFLVRVADGAVNKFQDALEQTAKKHGFESDRQWDYRPFQTYHYGQHVAIHFDDARVGQTLIDNLNRHSVDNYHEIKESNLAVLNPHHAPLDSAFGPSKKWPWTRMQTHIRNLEKTIRLNQAAVDWIKARREKIEQGEESEEVEEFHKKIKNQENAGHVNVSAHGGTLYFLGMAALGAADMLGMGGMASIIALGTKAYKKYADRDVTQSLEKGIHGEIALLNYFNSKFSYYDEQNRGESMDAMERRAIINETVGMLQEANREHLQTINRLKAEIEAKRKKP